MKPYKITITDDYYLQAIVWAENEIQVREIAMQADYHDFRGFAGEEGVSFMVSQDSTEIEEPSAAEMLELPTIKKKGKTEIEGIVSKFLDLVRSDEFADVKQHYKKEIALQCLAFNDNLYELTSHAINLYEGD